MNTLLIFVLTIGVLLDLIIIASMIKKNKKVSAFDLFMTEKIGWTGTVVIELFIILILAIQNNTIVIFLCMVLMFFKMFNDFSELNENSNVT